MGELMPEATRGSAAAPASDAPGISATDRFELLAPSKFLVLVVAVLFSAICFSDQYRAAHDPCKCTDAYAYLAIGERYAQLGMTEHPWSHLRLYGYPMFLAAILTAARLLRIPPLPMIYVVQLLLYFAGTFLLCRLLGSRFGRLCGDLVFYALIGNILVYPYLVLPLTDGFSVILLLFIVCIVLRMTPGRTGPSGTRSVPVWFFFLGCLVSFAIMVRPANVYYLGIAIVAAVVVAAASGVGRSTLRLTAGAMFLSGLALVAAPQVVFNYATYGTFTFLPAFSLGEFQIEAGKQLIKYATNLSGGNLHMEYRNPWFDGVQRGLAWYLSNPMDGLKTIFLHVFSAFDFDYLYCYVYDLAPIYRPLLFLLSHCLVFGGAAGYFGLANKLRSEKTRNTSPEVKRALAVVVLLYPTLLAGWLAIHALAAIESRFALPIMTAAGPLAIWAVIIHARTIRQRVVLLGSLLAYLIVAWNLSQFVRGLMVLSA
jgi:hypothetical protein